MKPERVAEWKGSEQDSLSPSLQACRNAEFLLVESRRETEISLIFFFSLSALEIRDLLAAPHP